MEEAHGRRDFELLVEGEVLNDGVTEADIANTDPWFEFEKVQVQEVDNIVNVTKDPVTVVDDPETRCLRNRLLALLLFFFYGLATCGEPFGCLGL